MKPNPKVNAMKYLFVGGSKDGQLIDVHDNQRFVAVAKFPPVTVSVWDIDVDAANMYPEYEYEDYRFEEIRTGNTSILFYVLDNLTINDVLQMLFDSYTKPQISKRESR